MGTTKRTSTHTVHVSGPFFSNRNWVIGPLSELNNNGDGDGLEEAELERAICKVENPQEKEGETKLGVGEFIGTAKKPQKTCSRRAFPTPRTSDQHEILRTTHGRKEGECSH